MSSSPQLRPSAAPQSKDFRNRADERIWQKLRRSHFPRNKDVADFWNVPSAAVEAASLFRLLRRGNGYSVESLRELIAVSPADKRELAEWATLSSPSVAVRIELMIAFRAEVLAAFDRLVENAHRGDSSQPENT
jgi:hypothetical protein